MNLILDILPPPYLAERACRRAPHTTNNIQFWSLLIFLMMNISVFVRPPWAFLKSSILICSLSLDLNMSSPENWRHSVMFSSAESVTSRVEEKSRSLVTLEVPVCVARDISDKKSFKRKFAKISLMTPTSAFTFNTLLIYCAKQALTHSK